MDYEGILHMICQKIHSPAHTFTIEIVKVGIYVLKS